MLATTKISIDIIEITRVITSYSIHYTKLYETDFYQIDPRFGTLDEYIELSEKASEKGIKLVMDQVANHCGVEHWWMKDLPFKDWVNQQEAFENHQESYNFV